MPSIINYKINWLWRIEINIGWKPPHWVALRV